MPEARPPWRVDEARELARDSGPRAVVAEILERRRDRPAPNAWTTVAEQDALLARADALGDSDTATLFGVPVAVKDNIDVAGLPTTAAVPEFAYVPAASAPVVQQLLDAGALIAGKTNMDQFATGLSGTRSPRFGVVRNPFDDSLIAGGSSSGSALAVATGQVALALGTDTAGSGRIPAACCGIVGFKPTLGALSTVGVVPASPTFDSVSVFASTVADARVAFDAMSATAPGGVSSGRRRVGVPRELEWFGDDDARRCFVAAMERLDGLGVEVVPFDASPVLAIGSLLYDSALVIERAQSYGAFVGEHPDGIDLVVREIVSAAGERGDADALAALQRVAQLRYEMRSRFAAFDVLVVPTMARVPTVEEALTRSIAVSRELGTYTNFVNILDLAALAVPAGTRSTGVPFGVTFVSPPGSDHELLMLGAEFEAGSAAERGIALAVVGAHLRGQPLNPQLVDLGATFVAATTTSANYRLFDLGLTPRKPGVMRDPDGGGAINVEVWSLAPEAFAAFVAAIPSPLGVGKLELADGSHVTGFVCEPYALSGARDITEFGGWRHYLDETGA